MFKIISIMTVKNECDIIVDVIKKSLEWSDYIIVMDNYSSDGSWEEILSLSEEFERVIIWGRFYGKFRDSLRQRIYEDYRYLSQPGDWWCRLDADEIYIDNPKEFISNLPARVDFINSASFQYYLTEYDIDDNGINSYARLNYYKCNWSEIRFFKESDLLFWPSNASWPINLFSSSYDLIRLKHYQYRSLKQINNRVEVRNNNISNNVEFGHEKLPNNLWYTKKKLSVPKDPFFIKNRVVMSKDLESSDDYIIPNYVYEITSFTFKKKMKLYSYKLLLVLLNPFLKTLKLL